MKILLKFCFQTIAKMNKFAKIWETQWKIKTTKERSRYTTQNVFWGPGSGLISWSWVHPWPQCCGSYHSTVVIWIAHCSFSHVNQLMIKISWSGSIAKRTQVWRHNLINSWASGRAGFVVGLRRFYHYWRLQRILLFEWNPLLTLNLFFIRAHGSNFHVQRALWHTTIISTVHKSVQGRHSAETLLFTCFSPIQ